MKYKILVSLFFSLFIAQNVSASGATYRLEVDRSIDKRNIVLTHPETNDSYLIEVDSGCNKMYEGQTVLLSIKGSLNSAGDDFIRIGDTQKCRIQKARVYTHSLFVRYTMRSNTQARVKDQNGNQYMIYYPDSCKGIRAYTRDYIYAIQGSDELSTGDRLILPAGYGECSLGFVRTIGSLVSPENQSTSSSRKPAAVSKVKAFARNGSALLNWRASKESNIDYYAIAVMDGKSRLKGVSSEEIVTLHKSKSTSFIIPDLKNEKTYYFYVKAVNRLGEESSDWSVGVSATPKSSISSVAEKAQSSEPVSFDLKVKSETNFAYLIDWTPVPTVDRTTVIFEVDGERQWVKTHYPHSYIRIIKRSSRKGKLLKITIRAYLPKDFVEEQSIEFDF